MEKFGITRPEKDVCNILHKMISRKQLAYLSIDHSTDESLKLD